LTTLTTTRLIRADPGTTLAPPTPGKATIVRPHVRGKFLYVGDEKFYVRGVTYGPFRPNDVGCEYHDRHTVNRDFALMAASGVNAVRVYTVPPRWLLDAAARHGLRVMVGLPWEQHINFLDEAERQLSIEERVRAGVRQCRNHPAVLCYTLGNEIPAGIVRWYGHRKVEKFLHRLFKAVKQEDPSSLVTYVNFPTTEYLRLPFLDFISFNVYLEQQEKLDNYLTRLQNLADNKPLMMAEIGLDSMRNGEQKQADQLAWQIETTFAAGCCGLCVFAWTDEWHRGGHDIDDWAFGLTTRDRKPKPALSAVTAAFARSPFPADRPWPKASVVVCSYNGSRTIRETCEKLLEVEYPNYEVVVVDDGSTDGLGDIVREYPFRLIQVANGGLSKARNIGMEAAEGEIVAYLDDDAYPDPHWLYYLAHTFMTRDVAGVGGPNLPVPGDGVAAECVAHSPGGPNHVLVCDRVAEHIPGCNMAFRKGDLLAVGGCDPHFRVAGDDVDLCWRIQERGRVISFHPSAQVWHHRRHTLRGYLRQQRGYGKAEAMLEEKWPTKYNSLGHISWGGRVYGTGLTLPVFLNRQRVYHGQWGQALFQTMYTRQAGLFRSLPLMPEWYLLIVALMLVTVPGILWKPLLLAVPVLALAVGVPLVQAVSSALAAGNLQEPRRLRDRIKARVLIGAMHVAQPLARLRGRLGYGLSPWRRRGHHPRRFSLPIPRTDTRWSEDWAAPEERLASLEAALYHVGARQSRGGGFDRWDLEIRGGLFGRLRVLLAIEDHGSGRQLVRLRSWPRMSRPGQALLLVFAALGGLAFGFGSWGAGVVLCGVAASVLLRSIIECGSATATYQEAIKPLTPED